MHSVNLSCGRVSRAFLSDLSVIPQTIRSRIRRSVKSPKLHVPASRLSCYVGRYGLAFFLLPGEKDVLRKELKELELQFPKRDRIENISEKLWM